MDENQMIEKLKNMLPQKKFNHSIAVKDTAVRLAKIHNCDEEKARLAGLLHDCAKNIEKDKTLKMCNNFGIRVDSICETDPKLLHGPLGAKLAELWFDIKDNDILDAIYFHTIAKENMTSLCKIIYLADFIEPNRKFPDVESLRIMAYNDLDKAVLLAIEGTIQVIIKKNKLIHPNTINARNYIISNHLNHFHE